MIVEMLIFSGRPNPQWHATPEESTEILRRIAGDPGAPATASLDQLGYRGFSLRDFELGEGDGTVSEVRVRDGIVTIIGHMATRYFTDARGLESYLLHTAGVRSAIPAGVRSPPLPRPG